MRNIQEKRGMTLNDSLLNKKIQKDLERSHAVRIIQIILEDESFRKTFIEKMRTIE
jgi:hypothetical protein